STPCCAAALSTANDLSSALAELSDSVLKELGHTPHLAVLFVSLRHAEELPHQLPRLLEKLGTRNLLGCTGESIAANDVEIEGETAAALWAAYLPETSIETMHLEFQQTPEGGSFTGWSEAMLGSWPEDAALLMLGEPFSF